MATFLFSKSASAFLLTSLCLFSLIILLFHSYVQYSNEEGNINGTVELMQLLHHRKLLGSWKNNEKLEVKKNGGKEMDGWDQLRAAPMGPDPLHHHGGSPKPRISP